MTKEEKLSVASQLAKNWYAEIIAIDMFGSAEILRRSAITNQTILRTLE